MNNNYPKLKINKNLFMIVLFEAPNKGEIVDNFTGNIKRFRSDEWDETEFIEIESLILNPEINSIIHSELIKGNL